MISQYYLAYTILKRVYKWKKNKSHNKQYLAGIKDDTDGIRDQIEAITRGWTDH